MRPAVFFDRDGVLNVERGYTYRISDFIWIDGAIEAIKYFNDQNFYVFVVTNQSGISKGIYSEKHVENLHRYMNTELIKHESKIDDFFYSPYHPDYHEKFPHLSHLRKPNTGMLESAHDKWKFDKSKSFLIGDNYSDLKCAESFGIESYLFRDGNLFDFVKHINN